MHGAGNEHIASRYGSLTPAASVPDQRAIADGGEDNTEGGTGTDVSKESKGWDGRSEAAFARGRRTAEGFILDDDDNVPRSSKPPPQVSTCSACRLRHVRCEKYPEDGREHLSCIRCDEKGIECVPIIVKSRRLPQQRRRIGGPEGRRGHATRLDLSPSSTTAQLVDIQLQGALTGALLEFYFGVSGTRLVILDETNLISNFEAVSRRRDLLDPSSAALISVIIALAARMSDHPMLVGRDAPTLDELSTTEELSMWGRKRAGPCRALLEKAVKDIDDSAIMRKPSMESIAALVLAQGLLEYGTTDSEQAVDAYSNAYLSHIRYLLTNEEDEEKRTALSLSELGWTAYLKDALSATAVGKAATFTQDDVDMLTSDSPLSLFDIFDIGKFPFQNPQRIFFDTYRALFHHIGGVARDGAYKLTGHKAMQQPRLDEKALRAFIDGLQLSAAAVPLLESRAVDLVGPPQENSTHFTTNHNVLVWGYVRTLRLSRAAQLTVPLRVISARMRGLPYASDRTRPTSIHEVTSLGEIIDQTYLSEDEMYAQRLRALADEAAALAFRSAREVALQLELTMRCGLPLAMMAGVHVTFSRTSHWAQLLIDTPAAEEGGPADFSFSQKLRELGWVSRALKFSGWSFDELAQPARWLDAEIEKLRMKQTLWRRANEGSSVPPVPSHIMQVYARGEPHQSSTYRQPAGATASFPTSYSVGHYSTFVDPSMPFANQGHPSAVGYSNTPTIPSSLSPRYGTESSSNGFVPSSGNFAVPASVGHSIPSTAFPPPPRWTAPSQHLSNPSPETLQPCVEGMFARPAVPPFGDVGPSHYASTNDSRLTQAVNESFQHSFERGP